MVAIEYIDRDYDSEIVQVGQFELIKDPSTLNKGDRFVCVPTEEYKSGICDAKTMLPILCFVAHVSEWHIYFSLTKESKRRPAIAWDLCHKLITED